jgi:surface antigen
MGYHTRPIPKGVLGEVSKIQEELDELLDAEAQQNKILAMVELSDLYGALEAVATRYALSMDDLRAMAHATARAFQDGSRK